MVSADQQPNGSDVAAADSSKGSKQESDSYMLITLLLSLNCLLWTMGLYI